MTAARVVRTQVVVVGAGPVGLLLAGELRQGGARTVVLETLPRPTTESRASTLHARTMELLHDRGLLEPAGPLPHTLTGHFGGLPLDFTVASPYAGLWTLPQARTARLLEERALALGADLRRGHEVVRLAVTAGQVEVEASGPGGPLRVRAEYVVGCDGEQSTVRRLAGITRTGTPATRELLRADVTGVEVPDRRFQRLERGLAVAARRPDGSTRIMLHEFGATPSTGAVRFPAFAAAWLRVTGEDIADGVPVWVNSFRDASFLADRYRAGRVLLAGDAAHQHLPIGGQALNLGLQDAANLGWKLASTVAGRTPATLLDSYHEERHAVGRRVVHNIAAQAELLLGRAEVDPVRTVLGDLLTHPDARRHLARMVSGLDIRYGPDDGSPALLGSRLPPTALPARSTTALREGRGLLLLAGLGEAERAALRRTAAAWSGRVDVVEGTAVPELPGALLVRPDGHVAWLHGGVEPLETALRWWFGTPAGSAPAGAGRLAGRSVLVTHADRGPGRAIAELLAAQGALVAAHCDKDGGAADALLSSIEGRGGRAVVLRADLTDEGAVGRFLDDLADLLELRTGSAELDVLVATFPPTARGVPLPVVRRAALLMRRGGLVVAVSGSDGNGMPGRVRRCAASLAPLGVTVNAVLTEPGEETDGQVAAAVALLACDEAHAFTGVLRVAGSRARERGALR
ncbi:SDR family NAD(P)-dependent oxidoreductase [Streptomyces sp. NPDC087425]|uniref:SDR family NAD(P)-dependent oxidoreductase n=1 Tax=Streptomyces sp. NPDC087425 TaxID=3365787 RepID=UPI00382E2FD5